MKKYIASTPESLTSGRRVKALVASIKWDEFAHLVQRHGLDNISTDEWYETQRVLNLLKDIAATPDGSENLVSIGIKVIETSGFPPEADTILKALHLLNKSMDLNMRNIQGEHYEIAQVSERHIQLTDNSAWPHDVMYGYLFSICRIFVPKGKLFSVERTYLRPESPDSDGALYDLKWE